MQMNTLMYFQISKSFSNKIIPGGPTRDIYRCRLRLLLPDGEAMFLYCSFRKCQNDRNSRIIRSKSNPSIRNRYNWLRSYERIADFISRYDWFNSILPKWCKCTAITRMSPSHFLWNRSHNILAVLG